MRSSSSRSDVDRDEMISARVSGAALTKFDARQTGYGDYGYSYYSYGSDAKG